jgi:hypothetical protein
MFGPQRNGWLESARQYWSCSGALDLALIENRISTDEFILGRQFCNLSPAALRQEQLMRNVRSPSKIIDEVHYSHFPNPASEVVYLHRSQYNSTADVKVFDLTGRIVHQATWPAGHALLMIDLNGLTSGLFSAVVASAEGSKSVFKIVLE